MPLSKWNVRAWKMLGGRTTFRSPGENELIHLNVHFKLEKHNDKSL